MTSRFKFNWLSQSRTPNKFVGNFPILHSWQFKTSTHAPSEQGWGAWHSRELGPYDRRRRDRESHVELSQRPGLQVSQGPGSTAANSQQLETPTRPRAPRGSRGQGEDTLPPRGAGKGRDRNRRLGFPPPSAAHPHGPPRPRNPAPRAFLFAQVRRALSRPGRAARPRPVGSRAAPEWAGGTSVRRRGRGLGPPVPPPPGYNAGSRRPAGDGWRCASGAGVRLRARAELLTAVAAAGRRRLRDEREEGAGGGMEGTRGYSCSAHTNSRRCCFQLLPSWKQGAVVSRDLTAQRWAELVTSTTLSLSVLSFVICIHL